MTRTFTRPFTSACRSEHANLFHIMTEMLNIYQTLYMAGILDVNHPEDRSRMSDVALLILDSQAEVLSLSSLLPYDGPSFSLT